MHPLINQEIINLYDEYTHAPLPRRVFLDRLTKMTGSAAAAATVVGLLDNNYANAQTVKLDDPRISVINRANFPAPEMMNGHLAWPKTGGTKFPAVVVIHENRGLNPHTEDVARRFATVGFLALAPDALAPQGGYPGDEDKARELFAKVDANKASENMVAAVRFLKTHPNSTGKVAIVGYCWGGGQVNQVALRAGADLTAGAPYYGAVPAAADMGKIKDIKAKMQLHYAETDAGINARVPEYEEALKAAGVSFEKHVYPGSQHAFFNDTAGARYHEPSAKLAWDRTVAFFKANLGGPSA